MFTRIAEFLETRFEGEDLNVQLMLQHGHSSISAEFDKIKSNNPLADQSAKSPAEDEENTSFQNIRNIFDDVESAVKSAHSNIAAAEWFTYRKKGLLVPFGVGTIDQILLSVLQTKHVFVRLFGLAHKTIIIDEVHAYDAYMSTLLERLLEWLAALGSPVVILSATLPVKKRDALIKAYQTGLGRKFEDGEQPENTGEPDKYPRISYATAAMPDTTFKIRGLGTSPQNTKTLHLEWKDENNFVEELKTKLKKGGCAAIICNTVDKAQTLFAQLRDDEFFQGLASDGEPKLDLLHARFRFTDREMRVKRSLARFAKPDQNGASPHRPHTAVLISTQIIEQSLDLDFDLMISELAPADLLLQRAGRLQRHERARLPAFKSNESQNKPTLWIIKPETDANGDLLINDKGLPQFGKSGFVYDNHILFRSWLKLKDETQIEIPGGIENLIEDVYDKKRDCFDEKYLQPWNATKIISDKKLSEKRIRAKAVYLTYVDDDDFFNSFRPPLDEDDPEKHSTLRAQTRDEERPSVAVVLLTQEEAKSINLNVNPNTETSEFLIKREVKISRSGLTQAILANPDFKKNAWDKNALLRHHRLIILDKNKETIVGSFKIILDDERGILIE
ncbi:MAG: CRISPR-associated helicase Cas3', partial [Acidobacteriota bacterium]|nr:CRISPR-associated helicase Cas3' [Acidobacteriota bacterium]